MEQAGIVKNNKLIPQKEWFKLIDSLKTKEKTTKEQLKKTLVQAIQKRIPKNKFGIYFSGGIDSSLIAHLCKKKTSNFTCYAVGCKTPKISTDIKAAQKAAKLLDVNLKYKIYNKKEAEEIIKKTTKIVGPNVVNVGVGATIYAATQLAKEDNINYLFSGLGSEEIFAGYQRHDKSKNINKECWKGLKTMWKRDFQRDFALAQHFNIKVAVPFLDKKLIKTAMQIPGKEKINDNYKKVILRKVAEELNLPKKIAWRKKKAAQYGSRFDKVINKLAKKENKKKSTYLKDLHKKLT